MLARLLEQIAYPGGADADKHLDKFRSRDRKERHPGLAGDGAGEQGLAGPGRADQQHAFGRTPAEPPIGGRVLQEVDDLDQLFLGLVHPGDIGKGGFGLLLDIDLSVALADLHHPAETALPHAADGEHPDSDENNRRQDP